MSPEVVGGVGNEGIFSLSQVFYAFSGGGLGSEGLCELVSVLADCQQIYMQGSVQKNARPVVLTGSVPPE